MLAPMRVCPYFNTRKVTGSMYGGMHARRRNSWELRETPTRATPLRTCRRRRRLSVPPPKRTTGRVVVWARTTILLVHVMAFAITLLHVARTGQFFPCPRFL